MIKMHHMTLKKHQNRLDHLNNEIDDLEKLINRCLPEGYIIYATPENHKIAYYIMDDNDKIVDEIISNNEFRQWEYNTAFKWLPTYSRMMNELTSLVHLINDNE